MDLSAWVDETLGRRHPVVAVGLVQRGEISVATRGAGADADYEIGSISKGITGLLYVQALDRGEITPHSVLADFLPIGDVPAGAVTLSSITVHRSGLPRLPKAMHAYQRSWQTLRHGVNPYGDTLDELLEQTRTVELGKAKARYSNLGFELLGHALARAAGTTYPELARDRIFAPLGLDSMYVPAMASELRATALTGTGRYRDHRDAWTGEAVGPAGGIRSAITDMALLAAALLDGSAPGVAAIEPIADFMRGARVGAGWITLDVKRSKMRRQVTFHDGGTGGFRSFLGIDRAMDTGRHRAHRDGPKRDVARPAAADRRRPTRLAGAAAQAEDTTSCMTGLMARLAARRMQRRDDRDGTRRRGTHSGLCRSSG